MFKNKELEYVLKPYLEIGMFEPKSGTESEFMVVNFSVKEEECLTDIKTFINYMPLKTLVDVTTSDFSNEDGEYNVFIELFVENDTWSDIMRLMYEMGTVSGLENWKVRVYKQKERSVSIKDIAAEIQRDA